MNSTTNLPNSKIIKALIEKTSAKTDVTIDYVAELTKFREIVAVEVSQINLLFPEYTPHEELYHLKRLFFVADELLGDELIERMNATELFLLSVALYGHDWGMAVNEVEKDLILGKKEPDNDDKINLLPNEQSRFASFCSDRGIDDSNVEDWQWQEYVRLTHAFRSGERVRKHFEPVSPGCGDFASRICEGHWLNFDVIDDYASYPIDAALDREVINVKALAIYVRLIDLLDLGDDRTPYLLWKYVAPRNQYSKLEWKKHRALRPVSFPSYQSARYIKVEGSTEEQDVYMAILDMKRYVDAQFRQCSDLLNRMNHSYHNLDLTHIDWSIGARGFEPMAIQFNFDRIRMFEILGDDIYNSNPYIFLRELIQNSVDAIEVRKEILDRIGLSFNPQIDVSIVEYEEGYGVEVKDNGIGMDEYIVRNYMSVAGRSYYRSSDFQKEGLKMDPISRFGIGVLSCFMVADYIEIETFKDPNTTQKKEPLKIAIPAKENYFKVSKTSNFSHIGTVFRVSVLKNKLPRDKEGGQINLDFMKFMQATFGFIQSPIRIKFNEEEHKIVYPQSLEDLNVKEQCVSYDYPYEQAFKLQDVDVVKEFFYEKTYRLRDLGLENYDGALTFLLPISNSIDLKNVGRSWPANEMIIIDHKDPKETGKKVGWNRNWRSFRRFGSDKTNDYFVCDSSYKVFLDGIQLKEITSPVIAITDETKGIYDPDSMSDKFVSPQLIVNLPKPTGLKIDLARTNIDTHERWDLKIWKALADKLKKEELLELKNIEIHSRLIEIASLHTFYHFSPGDIINNLIDSDIFPLAFLSNGEVVFKQYAEVKDIDLKVLPNGLHNDVEEFLGGYYIKNFDYNGILNNWVGDEVFIGNGIGFSHVSALVSNGIDLMDVFLKENYYRSSIEVISSPIEGKSLVQYIYSPILDEHQQRYNSVEFPEFEFDKLDSYDVYYLNRILRKNSLGRRFPTVVCFPEHFRDKLLFGHDYINIYNPTGLNLIKACYYLLQDHKKENSADTGTIMDKINDLSFSDYSKEDAFIEFKNENDLMFSFLNDAVKRGYIDHEIIKTLEPLAKNLFIDQSVSFDEKEEKYKVISTHESKLTEGELKWGKVLNKN